MSHRQVPCDACGRPMIWLPTKAGKRMPVNAETVGAGDSMFDHKKHVSHFSDCPAADRFRRSAEEAPIAPQTRGRPCRWPRCPERVPSSMWGCKKHWFMLPWKLRNAIWRAYSPGQEERLDPSDDYVRVEAEAQAWIRENHPETA